MTFECTNEAPRQIVRRFSPCGPCLTEGLLVRETAKFYVFREWRGGDRYEEKESRIAKDRTHIKSCHSCRDHAQTSYPNGYMD